MKHVISSLVLFTLFAAGCAGPRYTAQQDYCRSGNVLLDAHFDGGQLGHCTVPAERVFELAFYPEDAPPINPSPWYAYRVSGQPGDEVVIRMSFHAANGYARYWPKTSEDGTSWERVADDQVTVSADNKDVELRIRLSRARLWVSGQEILAQDYYRQWINELEERPGIETGLVGASREGRPIYLAETANRPEFILLIGRQHPPEVTGAVTMRSFVDTVLADTELARQFRGRFKLAIVPLMNPDGVAAGHWRHNEGGVDVNRDWGPFTQPESRSVLQWVERQEAAGGKLQLMLDFHSTFEDLFYTQPVTENPPDFASIWLGAAAARLPDFPFKHSAGPTSEQPNSKNYFHTSRGIPAITYESGDETGRGLLEKSAVVFAEEMMKAMLARTPD